MTTKFNELWESYMAVDESLFSGIKDKMNKSKNEKIDKDIKKLKSDIEYYQKMMAKEVVGDIRYRKFEKSIKSAEKEIEALEKKKK